MKSMVIKVVAWYSAIMLSLTLVLALYGFIITKQISLLNIVALYGLYCPPAVVIWMWIFKKI